MVASRILAYGPEYECEVTNPNTNIRISHTFNLAECPYKKIADHIDTTINEFELELPISKVNVKFKLLTGKDEKSIEEELKALRKIGQTAEITTRLKRVIIAVNGDTTYTAISAFVDNMLSKDSLYLREYIREISPDIVLKQEVELEGDTVSLDIPMTVNFFWPES
jgi:hypothetical protein